MQFIHCYTCRMSAMDIYTMEKFKPKIKLETEKRMWSMYTLHIRAIVMIAPLILLRNVHYEWPISGPFLHVHVQFSFLLSFSLSKCVCTRGRNNAIRFTRRKENLFPLIRTSTDWWIQWRYCNVRFTLRRFDALDNDPLTDSIEWNRIESSENFV